MTDRSQETIEETLLRELRFGGLNPENLKELVGIVAGIQEGGLRRLKVFPKGIPPVVDSLRVSGIVDASAVTEILSMILTQTPRLTGVTVFPYGIPWPDIFRVNVDLGAPVEAGSLNEF